MKRTLRELSCKSAVFSLIGIFYSIVFVGDTLGSGYTVTENNAHHECNNFNVVKGKIVCSHDGASFVYAKENIQRISYKDIEIFPYKYDEKKVLNAINERNCNDIIRYLYGALYVDKIARANVFVGSLHERGVCVQQDLGKALEYYKLSGLDSDPVMSNKINEITGIIRAREEAKAQKELQQALEMERQKQEAERLKIERLKLEKEENERAERRMKEAEDKYRPTCEVDCAVNKYQFSTSCFKACMHAHGLMWF